MDGGINFSPSNVSEIPLNYNNEAYKKAIGELAAKIFAAKKQDAAADTTEWEREIDRHVYVLYDLTPKEIAVVEGSV